MGRRAWLRSARRDHPAAGGQRLCLAVTIVPALVILAWAWACQGDGTFVACVLAGISAALLVGIVASILVVTALQRRWAVAVSAAVGLVVLAGGWSVLPPLSRAVEAISFFFDRPDYDRIVERERLGSAPARPVRVVLHVADRPVFLGAFFVFIIYDETDETLANPRILSGSWRWPGSKAGQIILDGTDKVEWLTGHYYRVECYPA